MRTLSIITSLCLALLCGGCVTGGNPDDPAAAKNTDMPRARQAYVCFVTAQKLDENGYADEAIGEYEQARDLDPTIKGIARRLAVLYDRKGDDQRAAHEYHSALSESPFDPEVNNDYGVFYIVRNDGVNAEPRLRLAVSRDPHFNRAWINLGTALAEQRKYSEAYGAFTHVLTSAQSFSDLGMIQAQQGDFNLAEESLKKAQKGDPYMPQTNAALEWVHKQATSRPSHK